MFVSDHWLFHFSFASSLLGILNISNITVTLINYGNLYSYKQNSQNLFLSVPYHANTWFSWDLQEWSF